MKPVRTFTVVRPLPARLAPLQQIAYNLWWSWNEDGWRLFERLHPDLWELTGHNPMMTLERVDPSRLDDLAEDDGFIEHMERVADALAAYLDSADTWYRRLESPDEPLIAYFSAEFAVTESLPIFSGGLGVLAGDHLKSASDLGIPLVAIGLLYRNGYFRQRLDPDGRQVESYVERNFDELPVQLERWPDGAPVTIELPFPGRRVQAQVWRADVGRIRLFLLDTNLHGNWPDDREITSQLYGGDNEMRIKQEIVLGIGGYRALEALGLAPTVYHMNEGHSAFLALEHTRRLMQAQRLSFAEAREAAAASLLFTTHTPVAAGHDYFPVDRMQLYFGAYANELGLGFDEFMALGREDAGNTQESFCMTVLALRAAGYANGVSRLHGVVSREMWRDLWPGLPQAEVPIGHVTNGVHLPSWLAADLAALYDRVLPHSWRAGYAAPEDWRAVQSVPDEEIWSIHQQRKDELIRGVRVALRSQLKRREAGATEIEAAARALNPNALTIGFARRFATYKRATLLLRDRERLQALVTAADRPVQFVFAGKAHPKDAAGKEFIHEIAMLTRAAPFAGRVVFLEDYDPAIARLLVQGVDVWLNTPRRPYEASGTSGMKAAANGVLNLSVLDGWWAEAWELTREYGAFGWAFGQSEGAETNELQDEHDARDLIQLLETEVVPLFYERDHAGRPARWIERMKASIAANAAVFNTHRMVQEYTSRHYLPLSRRYAALSENDYGRARALAEFRTRLETHWPELRVRAVDGDTPSAVAVGKTLKVRAWVQPTDLAAEELRAEVIMGKVNGSGELAQTTAAPMHLVDASPRGYLYEAAIAPNTHDGLLGYTVRVLPHHADLIAPYLPGMVAWANGGDADD